MDPYHLVNRVIREDLSHRPDRVRPSDPPGKRRRMPADPSLLWDQARLENHEALVPRSDPEDRERHPFHYSRRDQVSRVIQVILALQAHRLYRESQAYPSFLCHLWHRADLAVQDLLSHLSVREDPLLLGILVVP